jgi:hypothetical protein
MAQITVRALDPVTWEPQQGNGQNNFLEDLQAVTQIIATRLKLFQGEWFLNMEDGLPMFQQILGSSGSVRNLQVIINLISARILGTPFVTSITNITAEFQDRKFTYKAVVATEFGTVIVQNAPGSSASLSSNSTDNSGIF